MSKYCFIFLLVFVLQSCDVEKRIGEHSYTGIWYYEGDVRYQVYKTRSGTHYIIVPNKANNKLKRRYID